MQIKNIAIGIAIIVLTMFVVVSGINTFYEKPQYNYFCSDLKIQTTNQTVCESFGGKWSSYDSARVVKPVNGEFIEGYCDTDYNCRKDYDNANQIYSRNVFIIAVPLGIIIIALGAYFFALESVGAGLMGGGVGTLIYGAGGYWSYAENLVRFIISLIGLAALIWFAYWFNSRKK